ncbi:hypothetical protein HDZ31DRAFT_81444 [Schizophyllum fasciatum]
MSSASTHRVAIVTGAAQGIGKAIALRLASDGLAVALNDLPEKRSTLDEIARAIKEGGGRAVVLTGDVSQEKDVQALVDGTVEALGSLHVMVANAGVGGPGPFLEESLESFNRHMAVDAAGVFLCYQLAARKMIELEHHEGRLIGAASLGAKQALAGLTSYTAAKFAVRGLTQSAALACGKYGITANAYAPVNPDAFERLTGMGEEWTKGLPIGRIGQPEDVTALVSFLASKESSYITGAHHLLQPCSVDLRL